jgi:hypothetical protein
MSGNAGRQATEVEAYVTECNEYMNISYLSIPFIDACIWYGSYNTNRRHVGYQSNCSNDDRQLAEKGADSKH